MIMLIANIFISIMLLSIGKNIIYFFLVKRYLSTFKKKEKHLNDENLVKNKIVILIPVYKETNLIKESIHYFSQFDFMNVIYVTTSKETDRETYKIATNIIEKNNYKNIYVKNSPNIEGNMATQLNYGLQLIENDYIVGIYNVDSRPSSETFNYVLKKIKYGTALQQVSFFDDNLDGILASAQRWQNRWSILYEFGKLIIREKFKVGFMYSIGHGFFATAKMLKDIGGWDDEELNEDNIMGYKILTKGYNIIPIPYFEKSDYAREVAIYIKQQSTWFNGPFYAFNYFLKDTISIRNFILSMLNFYRAMSWLMGPLVLAVLSLWSIESGNYLYLLLLASCTFIYISGLNHLSSYLLKEKINYSTTTMKEVIYDFMFYFFHCLGPIITVYKVIKKKNTIKNKYVTEK